jgi:hypothetical protein
MIAASAARADLAVAHEALSALDVPASPSVATRVRSLGERALSAEAFVAELVTEIQRLRSELATYTRADLALLRDLESEARFDLGGRP